MPQADARFAPRLLAVQAALSAVAAILALPFGGAVVLSVSIGASVCLIANALAAAVVSGRYRAQAPERIVMRFYGAELAKIVLILAGFGAALLALDGLSMPAMMGAYLAVQAFSPPIAAQWASGSVRTDNEQE